MRNKFFKNRIIPVLLSLFMIISMLSINANAQDAEENITDSSDYIITPMLIGPNDVCAIGETGYADIEDAISAAQDGETIRILKDINKTFTNTIIINKNVTFDLIAGNLTIFKSHGLALEVKNCTVSLIGTGYIDVIGGVGIQANNANITVRNVTGNQGDGAYAYNSGKITVLGEAKGYDAAVKAFGIGSAVIVNGSAISTGNGSYSIGAKAEQLGVVTINGDAKGYGYGAYAYNYGTITVEGDVTTTEGSVEGIGAYASDNSKITINGSLSGEIFAQVDGTRKDASEKTMPSTKAGYDTYHETTSTIWVKATDSASVCEIDGIKYTTLIDALNSVQNNSSVTIKMLGNFIHQGRIVIEMGRNKQITFDLNGHTLDIISEVGSGVYVTEGSSIDFIDNSASPGSFNVTGREVGVWAENNSSVKVSNATATAASTNNDTQSYGAYARYGAQITVTQNAKGNKYGAYADSGYGGRRSKVIVCGNAISENIDESSNPRAGAIATNYADVVVCGNALGGRIGVYSGSSSTAKVEGNATGGMYGAYAEINSTTEVLGDVRATSQYGYAAYNLNTDSLVIVKGNAIAETNGVGAVANMGSITIDGVITADIYVRTGSIDKSFDEYIIDPGKLGYLKYTNDDGTAIVWVKENSADVLPTVLTGEVTNITSNGAVLSGSVSSDGGSAITEIGYVYSNTPNPIIDGEGVSKTILGNSYNGLFEISISGLSAGMKYYVRAYAKNSVGVSYGYDVSFTTLTSNPPNPPVSEGSYTPQMPAITVSKEDDQPAIASIKLNTGVNDKGNASIIITEQYVKALIEAAKKYAESKNKIEDGTGVSFYIQFSSQGRILNVIIEEKALILLEKEAIKQFNVNSPLVNLSFDKIAIQKIKSQSSGNLTLSVSPVSKLSVASKLLIGKRPVYDLTIAYNKKGNTEYITDLGQGTVTIGIAYKADSNENSDDIFAVYVDKNGKPQLLENSYYKDEWLNFERNSFSVYGVAYKKSATLFNDTIEHWAKNDIDFAVEFDLIPGTGTNDFSPDKAITRAEFIMALGKLYGEDMSKYKFSSFVDVSDTNSYLPYIEWAVNKGIVQGIGNDKFGSETQITREQMAVMMVNYVKAVGYELPALHQVLSFADDAKISLWAKDAVKAIQQAGIIIGKNDNLFDPAGSVTRAEASTILRRFVDHIVE